MRAVEAVDSPRIRSSDSRFSCTRFPCRDHRGQAVSVIMLGVFSALILVAGLVVDGGQKARAISRAETVAAGAARAAANAGASGTFGSEADRSLAVTRARQAAEDYLDGSAQQGESLSGQVTISGIRVTVRTEAEVGTIFLSVIGIDRLTATGQASARIIPNR